MTAREWIDYTPAGELAPYPLAATVERARAALNGPPRATGLTGASYLEVVHGIVACARNWQQPDGRIVDPYAGVEKQYSTPYYAFSAATLAASGVDALLESAVLALESALRQLADGAAADGHGDFFIFPALLARERLLPFVARSRAERWDALLRRVDPAVAYRTQDANPRGDVGTNWNVVALAGEFLRQRAGFTGDAYVARGVAGQLERFTLDGLYRDPGVPLAYDLFARVFLDEIVERGYDGPPRPRLAELLTRGAWTSLLAQSPAGEWPAGGRSAQHQWVDAQQCASFELWAGRARAGGDELAARAFKRSARLALASVRRWIRPTGDLWIVKNRVDPRERHGFERYSHHAQYNLLAAGMLALAWERCDDTIPEGDCPAERGGFVVELPEFHKVIANAGGLYVEVETAAQPKYDSTGLLRVHRAGCEPLLGPSANAAATTMPLATGVAWRTATDGDGWQPLAALRAGVNPRAEVVTRAARPERVRFDVRYSIGPAASAVVERYDLTPERLSVDAELVGLPPVLKLRFPLFLGDGARQSAIDVAGNVARVRLDGAEQEFRVTAPAGVALRRAGRRIPHRNGFVDFAEAEVAGSRVAYTLTPRAGTHDPDGQGPSSATSL